MIKYITIANDEDNIQLTIGVDLDKVDTKGNNILFMPSIKFDVGGIGEDIYWDNDRFIFDDLKRWCENYLSLGDNSTSKDFEEVSSFLDTDGKVKEVLQMLNLAIVDGWDNNSD